MQSDTGTWGSICGELGPVLEEAIAPIVDACTGFEPEG
jgi:hypothetical protein